MARSASRTSSIAILAVIGYVILSQHTAFVNPTPSHGSSPQLRSRVCLGPLKDQIAEAQKTLEIFQEAQKKAELDAAKANADSLAWTAKTFAENGLPQAAIMQAKANDALAAYESLKLGLSAPVATAPPSIAQEDCPIPDPSVVAGLTKQQIGQQTKEYIKEAQKQANLLTWAAETAAKKGMSQAADLQAKALSAVKDLEDMKACAENENYGASAAPVAAFRSGKPVTMEEVKAVQTAWAGAIKHISKVYLEKGDYVKAAADAAGELYAYGQHNVLFKPTKAAIHQFRPTPESAMSYFVGGKAIDGGLAEDHGFAINGGKGWADCEYENHQIELKGDVAIAMGNYYFTCASTGAKSRVEYTFGYQRCEDEKVRVFLHHSSLPYAMH